MVLIQMGSDVWEVEMWALPLVAEAILKSTSDEVKIDINQQELMGGDESAAG